MTLHSPAETARLVAVAKANIYRAIRAGELPALVDGRGWYQIDLETARAWAAKRYGLHPITPATPAGEPHD